MADKQRLIEKKGKAVFTATKFYTIKPGGSYGVAIRKGESGADYTFKIGEKTAVPAEDLKAFQNPQHKQYVAGLMECKANV